MQIGARRAGGAHDSASIVAASGWCFRSFLVARGGAGVTEVNFHVRGHSEGFVFSQLAGLVAVDAVHSDAHHARLGCDGDLPQMPSPS